MRLPLGLWRCLLVAITLLYLALDLWANTYGERVIVPSRAGTLDAVFGEADQDYYRPILSLDARSPLSAAGLGAGDKVKFDNFRDELRQLGTDELVGVTVAGAAGPVHLQLRPVPDLDVHASAVQAASYVTGWAGVYFTLCVALLIGWRRADSGAMRSMAMAMTMFSPLAFAWQLPGGAWPDLLVTLILPTNMFVAFTAFVYFTLTFPEERQYIGRPWVRRLFGAHLLVVGLICAMQMADDFYVLPWAVRRWCSLDALRGIPAVAQALMAFTALWCSWRASHGATRQKLAWITSCLGLICVTASFSTLFVALGLANFDVRFSLAQNAVIFCGYCGLAYAMLRHRLFDFGLAVNRLTVWLVVVLVVALGVAAAEAVMAPLLQAGEPWQRLLLDGAIGALLLACYSRLHWLAERLARWLFRRDWDLRERRLQEQLDAARHVRSHDALLAHYLAALQAYSGAGACAIYLCRQGGCALAASSGDGAPPIFEPFGADLQRLRAGRCPVPLAAFGGTQAVARPMLHREELTGFILMATKPNDASYRPDEVRAFANVAHHLNLDLQAEATRLQASMLEQQVALELDARKRAEESTLAKSRFLAAASHDLRQPIHAQGLFLEVLARSELSAQQREVLACVRSAAQASSEMLDTLLDFSRIEAGVIEASPRPFALQPLLNKLENELAGQADAKGIVYRSRDTEAIVLSDPALVELILRNLVSNAIRYTGRGGVLIGCRQRGGQLVFEVWDTGIGIHASQQRDIFLEFNQLGNPERDRRKGLGLGLAIAEGLSRTLGCELSLASQLGRGSVFRLSLPLSDSAPLVSPDESAIDLSLLKNVRVLVIDDEEMVGAGMRQLLINCGCDCVAVASIEAAMASARTRAPQLIISDYRLREQGNGAQAISALRAICGFDVPALLITGDTAPERLREANASGIPLLHKPVATPLLFRQMAAVLAR